MSTPDPEFVEPSTLPDIPPKYWDGAWIVLDPDEEENPSQPAPIFSREEYTEYKLRQAQREAAQAAEEDPIDWDAH
jgi:hypothetical protein